MRSILNTTLFIAILFATACSTSGTKEESNLLGKKKAQLEKLKKDQENITAQITQLNAELAKLDPSLSTENAKLIAVTAVGQSAFTHYIDLQGMVNAENIAYVTPRNGGGQVKAIFVKKGDYVKKGQLLLKLDDVIIKRQITQAETQLAYAKDIYDRRNNLWKQSIGAEVDLITANNNVDQIQRQIETLKEQLGLTNVYADMTGVAEDVTIRLGELFTGSPQGGFIKLVNTDLLKVTAQVPENYMNRVKVGGYVTVTFPDINKTVDAKVTLTGKIIDPNSRSFYVEAHLPSDKDFKPNQIALVKILDYSVPNAITVPVNTIQTDDKGKFVMVAQSESGKLIARKRALQIGELYGDKLEVKSGLQLGENVITEGFQNIYDGQLVTLAAAK